MSTLLRRSMFEPRALSGSFAGLGLLAVPVLWLVLSFLVHSPAPKVDAPSSSAEILRFDPLSAPTIDALQRLVMAQP